MTIAQCNVCAQAGAEPFKVPWDEYGAELMRAHFREHHPDILLPVREAFA